jgi:hypothetical protein
MACRSQKSIGGCAVTDWQSGFEKLCGRKPSDKEIQTALTIQNNFGIRNNDAIFPLLVVLGYHRGRGVCLVFLSLAQAKPRP